MTSPWWAPKGAGEGTVSMVLIYWVVFFLAVAETGVQLLLPPYLYVDGSGHGGSRLPHGDPGGGAAGIAVGGGPPLRA